MIKINPIELDGLWNRGFALDYHTIKSIPIGEDPFGHMQYETSYTPIGKVLKEFKYKNQYDNVYLIVDAVVAFLDNHPEMRNVQSVLPVPPSNKARTYQPTFEIAELLAQRLGVFCSDKVLEKKTESEYKNLSLPEKMSEHGVIVQKKKAQRKINILLIDDIYQTGSTMRQCAEVLGEDPNIDKVFVITITKTKK